MKQFDNIDEFFRQGLQNGPEPAIPEHYLADINQRLDALEKKNKRGFWYWLLPGLLLAGMGLAWALVQDKGPQTTAAVSTPATVHTGIGSNAKNTTVHRVLIQPGKTKNRAGVTTPTPVDIHTSNVHAPTGGLIDREKAGRNRATSRNNGYIIAQPAQPGMVQQDPDKRREAADTGNTMAALPPAEKNTDSLPAVVTMAEKPADTIAAPAAPSLPATTPKNRSTIPGLSISLLAGTQLVINTFPGQSDDSYYSKRKNEEKPIYGTDASLLLNKNLNTWTASAGFNYSEWGEKLRYTPLVLYDERLVTVIDTVADDTSSYYEPVETVIDRVTQNKGMNKYRYFSLLLMAGYNINLGSKCSLRPQAGLMAGCITGPKTGQYTNREGYGLVSEKGKTFLFNAHFSLETRYALGNFTLLVVPFYRFNLNRPVHSKDTQNRYRAFGLQAGLLFNLP